jgi:hypothetical protein
MNAMKLIGFGVRRTGMACFLLTGMFLVSCSSTPEPQPEPSKKEIKQDSDRFFEKMKKEENQSPVQK